MAMDTCPHCGSPGAFDDAVDGRCPVCGMALPFESETYESPAEATEAIAKSEPVSSTLRPEDVESGEATTIALQEDASVEDQHELPKGIELIKPRKLSPEYANRVTAAWRQTQSQFRDPQETIKSEKSGVFDVGELNIGSRVVGPIEDPGEKDYELTEVIGEGAMGTIWSARQASLNRDVAIKIPKRAATKSDLGQRQFMSEVVVTGQLDHPNVVPIYDLGKNASGELFYAMKRVDGRPWNALLEEHELDVQQNVEILMKVCDAIRFAHDRGVIHRDIKPHNVMVGSYGEVSVMDWGIALRLDFDAPYTAITRISPAGTPAYMAPEMATGSAGEIGVVTDVYLLGAVLYEILTGGPPHPPPIESQNQNEMLTDALLIAARNEITPIDQGGELGEIAYRAMATEVENRFQSVREFQDAIREALSHAESTHLTERGEKLLEQAKSNGRATQGRQGGRFDDFDRARFAFEEALQIWDGNRAARIRLDETLLAYASFAYEEGAYARGIALLSEEKPEHRAMLRKLKSARRRTNRLSTLLKAAALTIVVVTSVFSFFLYRAWVGEAKAKNDAIAAQRAAETAKNDAIAAQQDEERAKNAAVAAQRAEEVAKNDAIAAQEAAEMAKNDAIAAQQEEERAKNAAILAQKAEESAKNEAIAAQKEAQAASYAFEIALAAEELQRNAFDRTTEILTSQSQSDTKRPLRNWEWGHLKAMVSFDATTFGDRGKLLQGRVEATAISQNREWVAAGTGDGDVFVWRFDRSEQPVRLHYGAAVSAVAITADGSALLAAGRADGSTHPVQVWSLPARDGAAPAREFGSQTAMILSLDLSSDSSSVLTAAADGNVELSQLVGEGPTKKFVGTSQENSIWSVRFSPDGNWIVTAGEDGTVRVWNTELIAATNGPVREVRRFEGHEGAVYTAAFSPDGRYLVSGGRDRRLLAMRFDGDEAENATYSSAEVVRLRLSNRSGELQRGDIVLLGEHDAAIRSVSFAADGSVLFSAGDDHTIRVWDVAEGQDHARLVKTLRGHGGWVRSCVALPNDPQRVLSGAFDRRVRVWNWRKYAFPLVLRHESHRSLGDMPLTAGAASPGGQWVAAASMNGVITVWDMADPLDPQPQELAEGHDWQATTAKYFPDNRRLLTAGGDNTVLVWDALRGNELLRMGGWNAPVGSGWRGVATVSGDGKWIATGAEDNVLARIWDANSGESVGMLKTRNTGSSPDGERPEATALAFSPDATRLLVGDQWGTCYVSTASSNWSVRPFQAHPSKISAIKFLPDGQGFLTASYDGTVVEWAIQSDRVTPRETFRHADRVVALDLSRDGLTMITAAGSDDEQAVLRIWDRSRPEAPTHLLRLSEIGGERLSPNGENSLVRSVAIHPSEPQALVTVFDPQSPTFPYRIGRWEWEESSTNRYRLVSNRGFRDVSTALFAPHRESAMLTVGGRGARLQDLGSAARLVHMAYRPQAAIRSISFSADGRMLISASQDRSLKIWILDPQQRRWIPDAKLVGRHDAAINSVAFHPSRQDLFVTASDDGTAKLWQGRDGAWENAQILTQAEAQARPVYDAAFVSGRGDAVRVVTAGAAGAFLWAEAGAAPRTISQEGSVCCVAPSPGGEWIVVANGSEATIYDTATLQPAATPLTGHSAEITSLAFTPDGSRLFTTSRDYTVKLWDTQTILTDPDRANQQRELLTLEGHSDEVTSVTVISGPKYAFVLTTGLDGQAIVWPTEAIQR